MPRRGRDASTWSSVALVLTVLVGALVSIDVGPGGAVSRSVGAADRISPAPGTLIRSQQVDAPGIDGTAYMVEYWSRSVPADKPVAVSGIVLVPAGTAPAGGWPVVTWGHPTDGLLGNCAPSLDPMTDVPYANRLLSQGWLVVASDYLDENAFAPTSRKVLPYLVGTEAARNAIDIVHAARQLAAADAGSAYQVWGWSEGGQTALFVSDLASSYAPELTLVGVVALAPATELASLTSDLETNSTYWPLLLMLAAGYDSTYGPATAPLVTLLTATGRKLLATDVRREPQCLSGVLAQVTGHASFAQAFISPPFPASWQNLLDQNDPATFTAAGPAPVLLVQGSADTLVPPSLTSALAGQLCGLAPPQPLERWVYSGLDHIGVMGAQVSPFDPSGNGDSSWAASDTIGDVVQWMHDRFAGGAWPDPYVPTGAGATAATVTDVCS